MSSATVQKWICPKCKSTKGHWVYEKEYNDGSYLCLDCLEYTIPIKIDIGKITKQKLREIYKANGIEMV